VSHSEKPNDRAWGNGLGFIAEVRRRNVGRVGVAYLVTAWLMAQVADLVLENFHAPDWVIQAILVALTIGFPITLTFAWVFELTPEGLKREKDVDRTQSISQSTGRKLDRSIIVILLVALAYFIWESRFETASVPESPTAPSWAENAAGAGADTTSHKSIAVLPFVNMSSDPEQEYFSDGISEEILNSLARVKELKVAGRTSSFAFKGKDQDLRQIGQMLGVEHILEGSVRKSGATVRITAQLIQADDGFHLWSETYDRELDDVFAIQDEIAEAILEQLTATLIGLESVQSVAVADRTDAEVYDRYLLARQRLYERQRLSIEKAAELLDHAIAKDPNYAPAYAQRGIAELLLSEKSYGELNSEVAEARGRQFLDKALLLDPHLAEGWAGLGLYHLDRAGEERQAIEALQKALAINPSLIDASNWLAMVYGDIGDNRRALDITERVIARDPMYPPGISQAIRLYNLFGQQDRSWALLERIRPLLPGDPQLAQAEAGIWSSLGHPAKVLGLLGTLIQTPVADSTMKTSWGHSLLQIGQFEQALEEGQDWNRIYALSALGQQEEAMLLAQELAGEGTVHPLISLLDRTGRQRELIDFVESGWTSLDALERAYPYFGSGYGLMLAVARAYAALGNEVRFVDAMARVRAAHDRSNEQGDQDYYFLASEAGYYALAGERDRALNFLAQAVDRGLTWPTRLDEAWPTLRDLAGDPEFESIQARVFERVNTERAELGLDALSTLPIRQRSHAQKI